MLRNCSITQYSYSSVSQRDYSNLFTSLDKDTAWYESQVYIFARHGTLTFRHSGKILNGIVQTII